MFKLYELSINSIFGKLPEIKILGSFVTITEIRNYCETRFGSLQVLDGRSHYFLCSEDRETGKYECGNSHQIVALYDNQGKDILKEEV